MLLLLRPAVDGCRSLVAGSFTLAEPAVASSGIHQKVEGVIETRQAYILLELESRAFLGLRKYGHLLVWQPHHGSGVLQWIASLAHTS